MISSYRDPTPSPPPPTGISSLGVLPRAVNLSGCRDDGWLHCNVICRLWTSRASKLFSAKGQKGNVFGITGCSVSVATTQVCLCSVKAIDKPQNGQVWLCSNVATYRNGHQEQIGSVSHGLLKPVLDSNFFD